MTQEDLENVVKNMLHDQYPQGLPPDECYVAIMSGIAGFKKALELVYSVYRASRDSEYAFQRITEKFEDIIKYDN